MEYVDAAGMRLGYERAGLGPPLLLLHGAVCDGRVWRDQLEELSDEFTVIAWDAPGCGRSSDPPESFRLPDYARCLAEFVAAVGFGELHVLGHSWGSSLALELYRQVPSLPMSMILVGAYAGWAGSLSPDEVDRRLRFALQAADLEPGDFEPTSMPGLFSDRIPAGRAAELAEIMSEIRSAGTRPMALALAEADLRDVLGTIEVPTLLLCGDADERSPLAVAEALHSAIPRSTLAVMPGLGHECFLESATPFNAEVRRFVRRVGQ